MTKDISLERYFAATALTLWAVIMMFLIVVLARAATAISTTNLLLIMIFSTMVFKMLVENAHDVIHAVTDAVITLFSNFRKGEA